MTKDVGRVPSAPGAIAASGDGAQSALVSAHPGNAPSREDVPEGVAGTVWQDENGDWSAEIQAVGGYEQIAVIFGETEERAVALREVFLAALSPERET